MNTATTTTTETLRSSLAQRSPSGIRLPVVDPKVAKLQAPDLSSSRPKLRKLPSKNSSFSAIKSPTSLLNGTDSAPTLPDRSPEAKAAAAASSPSKMRRARSGVAYRAAERGSHDVLPMTSPRTPLRSRRSGSSMVSRSFSGEHLSPHHEQPHMGQMPITPNQLRSSVKSLRSRRRSSSRIADSNGVTASNAFLNDSFSDDGSTAPRFEFEDDQRRCHSDHFRKHSSDSFTKPTLYTDDVHLDHHDDDDESQGVNKKKSRQPMMFFSKLSSSSSTSSMWLNMKPPQFMTLMLLLAITCFVAGSYRQVLAATDQIEAVRTTESKLLVHLHKVEQQALELAETMHHMNDRNDGGAGDAALGDQGGDGGANSADQVDSDLIRAQVEKLRDMEAELDHEVRSLRKTIQLSAQQALVSKFGEGAIQVFVQVETVDENGNVTEESKNRKNVLALRLWYDTPHTGWTFLQQIQEGAWDGATFSIQSGRALVADPVLKDHGNDNIPPRLEPSLDFLEPSERGHERYTVTLTDSNLSINLQDNKRFHKQEACVGIIFQGFDVLHNMVQNTNNQARTVRIKTATASHMTRAETNGLI